MPDPVCGPADVVVRVAAAGAIDVAPLISHTGALTEFPDLFALFARGQTLQVQVVP